MLYEAVTPGQLDYSDVVSKLKSARVVFFGLCPPEAGLIVRQAHDHGVDFQLVAGDSLADEEFERIAGGVEGTLVMYHPDPMQIDPEATTQFIAAYREQFPVEPGAPAVDLNFSPYIGFRIWAKAVESAGSFDGAAVAQVLHSRTFDTMLGPFGFDDKGDVTGIEMWSWWAWENGKMVEKTPAELPPTH